MTTVPENAGRTGLTGAQITAAALRISGLRNGSN